MYQSCGVGDGREARLQAREVVEHGLLQRLGRQAACASARATGH